MKKAASQIAVILFGVLFLSLDVGVRAAQAKEAQKDYWLLTRSSPVIVKGTVTNVDPGVTLAVTEVLKGGQVAETVSFEVPRELMEPSFFKIPSVRFAVGNPCIVFLTPNGAGAYKYIDGTAGNLFAPVEQSVRDVLRFDSTAADDKEKCRMLISMAVPYRLLASNHALRELDSYNRPEFLDLLEPLAADDIGRIYYVRLLGANRNQAAIEKLKEMLNMDERKVVLTAAIQASHKRNLEDEELSKKLLGLIDHEEMQVRRAVVYAFRYRRDVGALTAAMKCLEDEEPAVRVAAVTYFKYCLEIMPGNAEILAKLKGMTRDPDENVRASAYRALPRDVSSFYRLFSASMFERPRTVRHAAGRLDTIWERRPFVISLLLLWPCIVVTGAVVLLCRGGLLHRVLIVAGVGLVGGYIAGMVAGAMTGELHSRNAFFHSVILIPPLFMPIGVLLSASACKYGRKTSCMALCVFAGAACIAVGVATGANTLWPSLLCGLAVLGIMVLSLSRGRLLLHADQPREIEAVEESAVG
jgi:hypothetical protein